MKFSEVVWRSAQPQIDGIKAHAFIKELISGQLDGQIFTDYLTQDKYYLREYFNCFAVLASKVPVQFKQQMMLFATETIIAEQELLHDKRGHKLVQLSELELRPATLAYSSYLKSKIYSESPEVGFAAVLPCFWVYYEVGTFCASRQENHTENPYADWITTYSSDEYAAAVTKAIQIFDLLAEGTTLATREKMQEAFVCATVLEWHFWNDVYQKRVFNAF